MCHKTEKPRSRYFWLQKRNQMILPGFCHCFHFSALFCSSCWLHSDSLGIGRDMNYSRLQAYMLPMIGRMQQPLFSCLCLLSLLFPLPFPSHRRVLNGPTMFNTAQSGKILWGPSMSHDSFLFTTGKWVGDWQTCRHHKSSQWKASCQECLFQGNTNIIPI